jgi:hypothetical protein
MIPPLGRPRLIQIDAPFSSRLSRHSGGGNDTIIGQQVDFLKDTGLAGSHNDFCTSTPMRSMVYPALIAAAAYESPAGPIRPLDMLYGHTRAIAIEQGHVHMAHRTGFTASRLGNLLLSAGFSTVSTRTENLEVCALALMPKADERGIQQDLAACSIDFLEQFA